MFVKHNSRRNKALLFAAGVAFSFPIAARADRTWDTAVANGSWNTPTNWLGGALPGASDSVTISFNDGSNHTITYDGSYSNSSGTVTLINQGGGNTNLVLSNNFQLNAQIIQLGANGKASVEQSNGLLQAAGLTMAGGNAASVATYSLSGGTVSVSQLIVGDTGVATFSQSGGTLLLTQSAFYVGGLSGGTGRYEMSGGTFIASGGEFIGWFSGSSQFVQSGGTHINKGVGQREGIVLDGFYAPPPGNTLYPTSYLLTGGTLISNSEDPGQRQLTQTGGVHKIGTETTPGYIQGGYVMQGGEMDVIGQQYGRSFPVNGGNLQTGGTVNFGIEGGTFSSILSDSYELDGGVLNVIGSVLVGGWRGSDNATFTQSGGTHSLGTATSPGSLVLADGFLGISARRGTYLLNGNSAVLKVIGTESVGLHGQGSFLQTAGAHTLGTASSPSQLYVGQDSISKGLYKLSGGTFLASGTEYVGFDGVGTYQQTGGFHSLAGSMYLGGSDTLASATGKGVATFSGGTLNLTGTLKLWNNATASYSGGSVNVGALDVTGGLFKMVAAKSRVLRTGSISTSSGGKIDLNDNSIIVDYPDGGPSPKSSIASQIQSGYASGSWNGPGINSSIAAADSSKRIGYADNAQLLQDSFSGEPVDHSSVLIKLTWGGDANLDGAVNIEDLYRVASNWNQAGDWSEGDFDYNGTIDVADLSIVARNWQASESLTALETSLGLPLIDTPDPSSAAFAALVFSATATIRRRSRR